MFTSTMWITCYQQSITWAIVVHSAQFNKVHGSGSVHHCTVVNQYLCGTDQVPRWLLQRSIAAQALRAQEFLSRKSLILLVQTQDLKWASWHLLHYQLLRLPVDPIRNDTVIS
jgi:hypothetical protein